MSITLPSITSLFPPLLEEQRYLSDFFSGINKHTTDLSVYNSSFSSDEEKQPNFLSNNEQSIQIQNPVACRSEYNRPGVVKIKFTPQEDQRLTSLFYSVQPTNWNVIALFMPNRTPRQCRDRWKNYLNPELRNDPWTPEEDQLLCEKYKLYGSKWGKIAPFFVNRSDNSCRNRWQLLDRKSKRLEKMSAKRKK